MFTEQLFMASKAKHRAWENSFHMAVFTNKKYKHRKQTELMRGTLFAC